MRWFPFRRRGTSDSTTAVTPARFTVLGGRRYMTNSPYALPKDLEETNRLNFQHFMLRQLMHGNTLAPITQPRSILDVGCGTGRWAMEMAAQYPNAKVVGIDLVTPPANEVSSLGNGLGVRPENCTFSEGNIVKGLVFPDQSFDFVHMRLLYSAIPATAWPGVIRELQRVTRVGGWVESVEAGVPPEGGPAMTMMHRLTIDGGRQFGLDMTVGSRIGAFLTEAGLANVQTVQLPVPLGASGGRVGKLMALDLFAILKGGRGMSVSRGIATAEAYDQALDQWPQEVDARKAIFPFYVSYGQRTHA